MKSNRRQRPEYYQALRRLPALKLKMATGTDFSAIYNFFFEHFGENVVFMKMGEQTRHPLLEQTLAHIARSMFKADISLPSQVRLIHLPDQHFIHGTCLFPKLLATFFYFEDLDAGMAAFASSAFSGETKIARFSVKQPGKPSPVSKN